MGWGEISQEECTAAFLQLVVRAYDRGGVAAVITLKLDLFRVVTFFGGGVVCLSFKQLLSN